LNVFTTALGVFLTALAASYGLLAGFAQWQRRRNLIATAPVRVPAVTILKPLCGDEFELFEQLRSFCVQDAVCVQIIFGVSEASDEALHTVDRLRCEFPSHDLRIVVASTAHAANRKVGNLLNMEPYIKHDYIVIADSDIRVESDYVSRVVSPLLDTSVGVVTCAYRSRARKNVWSRLGGMFIDEWFIPSVRVSARLGSQSFTSGATIALRRSVLEGFGGFSRLADQLADDFQIGALARARGLRTVLSEVVVETTVDEPTLNSLVRHQLRWLRTIRSVQPAGYAFSFITFTVPLALTGAVLAGAATWSLVLLAIATTCRLALHFMGSQHRWRTLWLVPIQDLLTLGLWCWSFMATAVTWRHGHYRVQRDGSLRESNWTFP
jgi:ceramide glucosyltransferase